MSCELDGNLRPMTLEDLDQVAALERQCFTTPWPREALKEELTSNAKAHYYVYEIGGKMVGYCGLWMILDEGHITNLAIDPQERGKGYAQEMLAAFSEAAQTEGARFLTLEVRSGNAPAIRVYEKEGFVAQGIRKGYYLDSGEDALIMWKTLEKGESNEA